MFSIGQIPLYVIEVLISYSESLYKNGKAFIFTFISCLFRGKSVEKLPGGGFNEITALNRNGCDIFFYFYQYFNMEDQRCVVILGMDRTLNWSDIRP